MKQNLTEEEYKNISRSKKNSYIKEWVCICNECEHKWHYLDSVEKQMEVQHLGNTLTGLGCCCNPCVTSTVSNANTQIEQQITKLKSCPKCGSSNVTKNAKFFKKE